MMLRVVLVILAVLLSSDVKARSHYQLGEHSITIKVNNATHVYKYKNDDFYIDLYNTSNKYTDAIMKRMDGRAVNVLALEFTPTGGAENTYNKMVSLCDSIITEVDGKSVRKNINHNEPLFVSLAVNSTTGKVEDVSYRIPVGDGFDEVSPETYYYLEKAFKENVSFVITDTERQFNYLPIGYRIYLPEKK